VLSVVLPVWNEARRLAAGRAGLAELRRIVGPLEVIWVDDGSTDGTRDALQMAASEHEVCIARPHRGKGAALRAGVAASHGDHVLLTDVDWSVPPAAAARLLTVDADLVIATREGAGARRLGEPLLRHWLGRAFNGLVQATVLAGHADTQCGCKVMNGALARSIFSMLTVDGFALDVELLYVAHLQGLRVREAPVAWRYESDSRVRPLRDALRMTAELQRVRANARAGVYDRR
jgi:glycosyltransferase involved in cell wall biosynthesis